MKERIVKALLSRIRKNGGLSCRITMKSSGVEYAIARAGQSSFEYLETDAFWVSSKDMEHTLFDSIEDVADFILSL